jgi:hypothetical protein
VKDLAEVCAITRAVILTRVIGGRNGYPDHYNRALAFSAILARPPVGFPCGRLSSTLKTRGEGRVYHVPCLYLSGLGCVYPPVAHRLRQGIDQPLSLATCLLAQA